jgi:hypothetical protein
MYALKTVTRKAVVRLSDPKQYVRDRLAEEATSLNLAGIAAARVELVNEAMSRLAAKLYTQDSDGWLPNVDHITHRIKIASPWGSEGWRQYGLRRWEARTLARILRARQANKPDRPPLYLYDSESNGWYLNLHDYKSLDAAGFWLRRSAVKLKEWRQACQTPCH